ncbi:MAG: hypothetical protein AAGB04_02250 [Pseudomonadota bacterium]
MNIQPLCRWLNACLTSNSVFLRKDLADQAGPLLEMAEGLDVVRPSGIASTVTCGECYWDHSAKIEANAEGNYGYLCIHDGWINVRKANLELVQIDRDALLQALALSVGSNAREPRHFAEGRLVQIGFVTQLSAKADWNIGYADGLEVPNSLTAIINALERQFKSGPGLIVTPSDISLAIPLPSHYRLIALHDLFRLGASGFVLNEDVVSWCLGHQRTEPRKRGPQSAIATTREVWLAGRAKPDRPSSREAQMDRIIARWPKDKGRIRGRGTIGNHLRQLDSESTSD